MPVNPVSPPQPGGQQPVVSLNSPVNPAAGRGGVYQSLTLYVATPAVLHLLGLNPATIAPATNILTVQAGPDVLTTITTATNATDIQAIQVSGYTSEPTSLITMNGLRRAHWTQIQSGWMIQSARPLTPPRSRPPGRKPPRQA